VRLTVDPDHLSTSSLIKRGSTLNQKFEVTRCSEWPDVEGLGMPRGSPERATMSNARDPAGNTLATIRAHLSAAETALADGNPADPAGAREAALVALRQATAAQDRFAWTMSHDLRNSFTAISGQAQLLERSLARDTLTPERIQRAVNQIIQSIDEANAILRKLSGL
jgi:signal transduction histidine kinase